jgi:hypothetical protein
MSLLSAMPGLSKHETNIPVVPFDIEKATRLLKDGLALINSFYPPGAMEWLRENRPDLAKQLKADWKDIDRAINAEDMKSATLTAETCIKHHRKAFEIFEGRPPSIEIQGDLLAA